MTKYRRLDANGDMTFGCGAESFAQGVEAVRQAIETRLRLLRGEWWERPADGLPLYQQMLGRPCTQAQKELMDLLVAGRIADTRGVARVLSVRSAFENRRYVCSARVETECGEIEIEVSY